MIGHFAAWSQRARRTGPPPVNVTPPSISGTPTTGGSTLTCTPGSWTGAASYAYQWTRDGVDIAGATGLTYTSSSPLNVGPQIRCRETATGAGGSTPATSNALQQTIPGVLGAKLKMLRTDGSLVGSTQFSAWNDLSSTAMNFAQPTSGSQPTAGSINGRTAANYDGANDLMTSGGSGKLWGDLGGNVEWWFVCEPDTAAADNAVPYLANALICVVAAWYEITFTLSGWRATVNDGVGNVSTLYVGPGTGVKRVVNVRHNGTTLTTAVDNLTPSSVACGPVGSGANGSQLVEGTNFNDSARFDGRQAIAIAANGSTITATERADVYAILAYQYGVTTP